MVTKKRVKVAIPEIIEPLKGLSRKALRDIADSLEARGDVEQSAVANLIRDGCDILDEAEK